ncbi:BNLF2b [macacine gammaherpesvirus 10]|uniref:BNLF2b n=1 Tax=macacine gammaherpesvirus 10 TaxID=2560569 RepID=A0A0S0BW32_9GAMA|nr:BNLF2b [macacine gammaherpesvirus 10]ALF03271.1 BNLF2b [macacine gammaherpesvirus 10]
MAPGKHLAGFCASLRRSLKRMSKRSRDQAEKECVKVRDRPPTPMPVNQRLGRRNALGGGVRPEAEECIYQFHPLEPALGMSGKNLDFLSLRCELGWCD